MVLFCFLFWLWQEAETLMERQLTVQKGNSLLQKQEEQLQELINSVAEDLGENVSRLNGLPPSILVMVLIYLPSPLPTVGL